MAKPTPSQTIGPFFHEGLKWATDAAHPSDAVRVTGVVFDRDGQPANDALLEIWQARRAPGSFGGLQRVFTDDDGRFTFIVATQPGDAPFVEVMIFARGLLQGMLTRVYVPVRGDAAAVELPSGVPGARRHTLIARASGDENRYEWDIRLQGEGETVFFALR